MVRFRVYFRAKIRVNFRVWARVRFRVMIRVRFSSGFRVKFRASAWGLAKDKALAHFRVRGKAKLDSVLWLGL
jgi:hypothetical protein